MGKRKKKNRKLFSNQPKEKRRRGAAYRRRRDQDCISRADREILAAEIAAYESANGISQRV